MLLRNGLLLERFAPVTPRALAKWLQADLAAADLLVLVSCASIIMALDSQVAEVERQILKRVRGAEEVRRLVSIPGLGPIAAAALYAFLRDPGRFRHGKAVGRYAGLDPVVYQSGQVYRIGRISKQGQAVLRWHLVEAASSISRFDPGPLGQSCRCLQARQGRAKAVVATARNLLVVAWAMWRRGEIYRVKPASASYARKLRAMERQADQATPIEELVVRLRVELSPRATREAAGAHRGDSVGVAA